ncbi:unnamed protein product [Agarophyton chilense]
MVTPAAAGTRRVKLYVLTDDGKWDDRGTGSLTCHPDPATKHFTVRVTAEGNGSLLLSSQLRPAVDAYYRRPEHNIISWNERPSPDSNSPTEVALSFADAEACADLWRNILMVDNNSHLTHSMLRDAQHHSSTDVATLSTNAHQSSLIQPMHSLDARPSPPPQPLVVASSNSDADARDRYRAPAPSPRLFDDNVPNPAWNHDAVEDVLFQDGDNYMMLPAAHIPVRLSPTVTTNLTAVEQLILAMSTPDRDGLMTLVHLVMQPKVMDNQNIRQAFVRLVSSSQFIDSLCNAFGDAETSGDAELLGALNILVRSLFRLGANNVLEVFLSEKYLTHVIGCLEYDEQNLTRFAKALHELKRKRSLRDEKKLCASGQQQVANASGSSHVGVEQQHNVLARNAPGAPHAKAASIECQSDSLSANDKPPAKHKSVLRALPDGDVTEASSEHLASREERPKSADGLETTRDDGNPHKDRDEKRVCFNSETKQEGTLHTPSSKNNDEETTSSGNMATQDLDKPLVLRRHRDFLERTVLFKSVIPITDASVMAKIHQNYRITYIRDVILSRANDETSANSLSNLIMFNNVDIIMYFISGNIALREVFERLNSALDQRRKLRIGSISSNDQKPCSAQNDSQVREAQSKDEKNGDCGTNVERNSSSKRRTREEATTDEKKKGEHAAQATESANSSRSRATQAVSDTIMTSSREVSTTTRAHRNRDRKYGKKAAYDSGTCDVKSSERSVDTRRELMSTLGFLKELCGIVRGQQLGLKDRFYSLLFELGVLDAVLILLEEEDNSLRTLACDILSATIIHNPAEVRNRILKNVTHQDSSAPRVQEANKNSASVERKIVVTEVVDEKSSVREGTVDALWGVEGERRHDGGRDEHEEGHANAWGDMGVEVHLSGCDVEEECSKSEGDGAQFGETSPVMGEEEDTDKENDGSGNEVKECNESEKERGDASSAKEREGEKEDGGKVGSNNRKSQEGKKRCRSNWRVETDFPLLSVMMKIICEDGESGVVLCMLDMVRVLVDPILMRVGDKAKFLEVFYGKFARRLLGPIVSAGMWHGERSDANKVENVGVHAAAARAGALATGCDPIRAHVRGDVRGLL